MYIQDTLRCPKCRRVICEKLRLGVGARLLANCWSTNCDGVAVVNITSAVTTHVADIEVWTRDDAERLENAPQPTADPIARDVDAVDTANQRHADEVAQVQQVAAVATARGNRSR